MPPDPLTDEDEQYASSEDSDFAPDDAPAAASNHSDSEDDAEQPSKKRRPAADADAEDAGYDNSGDEAIIKRGKRRKTKTKDQIANEDDEGGEGGLIKTRRQRAAEKEEKRYTANTEPVTVDVDALWTQMLAGKLSTSTEESTRDGIDDEAPQQPVDENALAPETDDDASTMIRIKRTYNFAGRVHTEEKLVPRSSAEAKLFLASQGEAAIPDADALPTKRATRKAFRSAFEPLTDPLPQRADLNLGVAARAHAARATKLNTVEKSRMDWAGYVDKEGIKDELELAGRSKESYAARTDFLARSEARRDDDARRARAAGRT